MEIFIALPIAQNFIKWASWFDSIKITGDTAFPIKPAYLENYLVTRTKKIQPGIWVTNDNTPWIPRTTRQAFLKARKETVSRKSPENEPFRVEVFLLLKKNTPLKAVVWNRNLFYLVICKQKFLKRTSCLLLSRVIATTQFYQTRFFAKKYQTTIFLLVSTQFA